MKSNKLEKKKIEEKKVKNEKKEKNKKQLTFNEWYEGEYKNLLNLDTFTNATRGTWMHDALKKFAFPYSSIWRLEVVSAMKTFVFPKKIDYIVTIFSGIRTIKVKGSSHSVPYESKYAFLYSSIVDGKVSHEYVCIGYTYKSADGEYRRYFIPYRQLMEYYNADKKQFNEIEKYLKEASFKTLTFKSNTFVPEGTHQNVINKIDKDIEKLRLPVILFISSWLVDINLYISNIQPNHISDNATIVTYSDKDLEYAKRSLFNKEFFDKLVKIKDIQRSADMLISSRYMRIGCGQKFIPLRVREAEQMEDIRHKTWKEIHVGKVVSDLLVNNVTASVPLFVDWFLIKANYKELYDNKISHIKLDHSLVAEYVVKQLEQSRRGTYTIPSDKTKEMYLSISFENLSDTIEYPMKFAEKELVMSDYVLCALTEFTGRTFADYALVLYNHPKSFVEVGNIFGDHLVFSKYVFEYIYAFYCLNIQGIIHGDAHLNNITLHTLRIFHKHIDKETEKNKPKLPNTYVVYNLGNSDSIGDIYIFPQYGKYATLIDFSRALLSEEHTLKYFPENDSAEFISLQRRRMLKLWTMYVPEFAQKNLMKLESALFRGHDFMFRIMTVIDSLHLVRSMKTLFGTTITIQQESMELLDSIAAVAQRYLVDYTMQILDEPNLSNPATLAFPNAEILRECFRHAHIQSYNPSDVENINIVDYFCANNPIKYSASEYSKFPPSIKYEEIEKAGLHVDKDVKYFKHLQNEKYIKSVDREAQISDVKEEVKEERVKRRGIEVDPKKQKKYLDDLAAAVHTEMDISSTAADFTSAEPF